MKKSRKLFMLLVTMTLVLMLLCTNAFAYTDGIFHGGPVFTPVGYQTVAMGHTLQFKVSATDALYHNMKFTASNLPCGAWFDPITNLFTFTPNETQVDTFNVQFEVTDGLQANIMIVPIHVTNEAPVLDFVENKTIKVNETLLIPVTASDAEGNTLTFSTSLLPCGAWFDPSVNTLNWTPYAGQEGTYSLVLIVSDGQKIDLQLLVITVVA